MGSRELMPGRVHPPVPRHEVRITWDFWLSQVPVTLAQFRVYLQDTGRKWETTRVTADDQPVFELNWHDALAFCDWLNTCRISSPKTAQVRWPTELAEHVATLPTEAERERACRGIAGEQPVEQEFACGDGAEALAAVAWFGLDVKGEVPCVQQKRPTDWGLHDLHGLVWEWCHDEYSATAFAERGMLSVNPGAAERLIRQERVDINSQSVVRGGSWFDSAARCHSAIRDGNPSCIRFGGGAVRVALVPGRSRVPLEEERAQAEPALGHGARREADAEWERLGGAGSAAGPPTSGP